MNAVRCLVMGLLSTRDSRCCIKWNSNGIDFGCTADAPVCIGSTDSTVPLSRGAVGKSCVKCLMTNNGNSSNGCPKEYPVCATTDGRGASFIGDSCLDGPCCNPLLAPGRFGNPICREGSACCPDGTWACSIGDGRTFPCGGQQVQNPSGRVCACPNDVFTCPNGSIRRRNPAKDCEFYPCEGGCSDLPCPADARLCPDGSYVTRDPCNQCKFRPCR